VRYLDHARLWGFVTEGEFWRITSSETPASIARAHVAFILECAGIEKLVTAREVVEGVGVDMLVEALPKEEVVRLLGAALDAGRAGKPFDDARAMSELSAAKLVEHVSLAHVWSRVIAPHVSFDAHAKVHAEVEGEEGERVSIDLVVDEPPQVDVEGMLSELRGPKKARDSVSDRVTVTPDPAKLATPRSGSG
jgi:hypothetical protein